MKKSKLKKGGPVSGGLEIILLFNSGYLCKTMFHKNKIVIDSGG